MCFSSCKNRKSKVKLWWVGARKKKTKTKTKTKKTTAFFIPFILSEGIFLTFVLSQYIGHWIHFQNINTFTYQKTLLYTLFYHQKPSVLPYCIVLRRILYLVYLCLGLDLFMLYLCDLFFIFSLIFIIINHVTVLKQFFIFFRIAPCHFWIIMWMNKANNFQIAKGQPQGVA